MSRHDHYGVGHEQHNGPECLRRVAALCEVSFPRRPT
jgi:hypothetical protein